MVVYIVNKSNNPLPKYETKYSSGVDLRAYVEEPIILDPGKRVLVPTGLYMEIENGYEGQVRPRSGLAIKHGITVLNSPGTIDSDYRGEIKVILYNTSDTTFKIENGDRIAQMVFAKVEQVELLQTKYILDETERGIGGFGHTGKQ